MSFQVRAWNGPVWLSMPVNGNNANHTDGAANVANSPYYFSNFFRGQVTNPLGGDGRLYYSGNTASDYASMIDYANTISREWQATGTCADGRVVNGGWNALANRCGVIKGTPFLPDEINPIRERNYAAYLMAKIDTHLGGLHLTGNVGVRGQQVDTNASFIDLVQKSNYPVNDTAMIYGGPGLLPVGGEAWSKPYSPLFKYEWGPTYDALVRASKATDGSPYDGIIMQYVNPATGGPVMKTLGACIQLLRGGERTKAHRHTGSVVYNVAKGSGHSIIAGKRFDWKKNDIFVVPSWAWHEHVNGSDREDAVLFSFSDLPSMHALGLYREEALADNGGHQAVAH